MTSPVDADLRHRVIADFTAEWQFWVREDGAIEHISAGCERIGGYAREDLVSGKVRLKDYVHPDDFGRIRECYRAAVDGGEAHDIVFRLRRPDGTVRWSTLSYVPVRDDRGKSLGFRGSIRDIHARKEAEEAVRRERDLLDKVVSSIGAGLVILDRSMRVVWYNAVMASYFGPLERNRGRACFNAFGRSPGLCSLCPVARALDQGLPVRSERLGIRIPDGRTRDFLNIATPLEGPDGTFEQCLELVIDITERRAQKAEQDKLREQLIQAQKMEAIGTLAGGIAHEFNNLLMGILGFASLLQMQTEKGTGTAQALEMIEKSATRAAELTKQLLGFARKGVLVKRTVSLNAVASEVLSIVRQTFDRAIVVRDELSPDVPAIDADDRQLEQVLLNMCINARDAMPSGGTLTVSTAGVDLAKDAVKNLPAGRYAVLSVRDTGTGIPRALIDRIFEPFFTTKETGKGTGMGLALAYGIVQDHGGTIVVDSAPGEGSTFRIYFSTDRRPR